MRTPQTKHPLWLLVMSSEACSVGQAIWALEKLGVPKRSLGEFKTDSIAFAPAKRKREAIKKSISDLRYCSLRSLKDTFMPAAKRQRRFDDPIPLVPRASDECVYRIRDMEEEQDDLQSRVAHGESGLSSLPPSSRLIWIQMTPELIY